jgi:hypothetical protein
MNVNNFENHLDQQEKNSHLNNSSLKATIASVLLSASASAEMNGTSIQQELIKNNKTELVQTLSNENEEKKAVVADYMEKLAQYADQLKGPGDGGPEELKGKQKEAVVSEFSNTFNIGGNALNISKVAIDAPKVLDLTTKKYISESQRVANGKYAYTQDYFLDATMTPKENQEYGNKLEDLDMKLTVEKIMNSNRHDLSLTSFEVKSKQVDTGKKDSKGVPIYENKYNVKYDEKEKVILFNDLLVFGVKGATATNERIKNVDIDYDEMKTKERIKEKISSIPFDIVFNKTILEGKDNIPQSMAHINLVKLLKTSIDLSKHVKPEESKGENRIANWSRALVVEGEIVKEVGTINFEFDDKDVVLRVKEESKKDGLKVEEKDKKGEKESKKGGTLHLNLFGFDLSAPWEAEVKNGDIKKISVNIPDSELLSFREHVKKSFNNNWLKADKTHLGDPGKYPNLNKIPYNEHNIMTTRVSSRIISADAALGF